MQLAGHPVRALLRYGRLTREAARATPDDARMAEAQAWIFAEYGLAWRHLLVRIPLRRVFGRDLFAWARRLAGSEIRFCRDVALARYGAQIRDPHLTATFDRLQMTVSSVGEGGFTFLYFLRMMRRGMPPQPLPAPLSIAGKPQAIYQETDSLLGEVNALRDRAVSLIGLLDRGVVRVAGGKAAEATIGPALHVLRRSHRLAARIDDLPGQIKALNLMAGLYGRFGALVRARALHRRARRKQRERCAACRAIERLVAGWF